MTHLLCIETGTDTCSVALAREGEAGPELVALRETHTERDHAARIAVYTDEVLTEAGIRAGELAAVAVSKGPGSYTGLRIGVSFAKGLCYGIRRPLIGIGSLESLCHAAGPSGFFSTKFLIPMIDARRMEVYTQIFDSAGRALTPPQALIVDEGSLAEYRSDPNGGEVLIFGSGAAKCREALPWARYIDVRPSARGMIPLAFDSFAAGRFENTAYFEPFYLKDFIITTPKKRVFP